MLTAKDARYKSRTIDEANELWEIQKAIEAACKENKDHIIFRRFLSQLVWRTLTIDCGFRVELTQFLGSKVKIIW